MSSSNLVRVAFIEESVYGETPAVGDFETARFTSDNLSGSPETTESQQIRTDRASSGQVVTGLTVGGDLSVEYAKEDAVDLYFKSALYNTWQTASAITVDLTIVAVDRTITRSAGDFNTDSRVGDIITLAGFVNTSNNTQFMIASIDSATQITVIAGDSVLVDEVGSGTSFEVADYLDVGSAKTSFSMEKAFLDLTEKAIVYPGMIVSGFNLVAAYGSIVTGSFSFSGNGYTPVEAAADFITDGRTLNPAATTNSMNGSIDMPFIANSATGDFVKSGFCIQSVDITLNNNLTPQTCIGQVAPENYSPGTAAIEVSLSAYLADGNWDLLAKKISQESFAIGFIVKNAGGYYGFYMPAVQVSFDDPGSAGINQDIILSMSGTAKVGPNGESPISVYRG